MAPELRSVSRLAVVGFVVLAMLPAVAPPAHAQADLSCVTIQDPTPLLPSRMGRIGMVITNHGPGPEPGSSAQLIFPRPIYSYVLGPTDEYQWDWEISQGTDNTCALFVDQGADGGADDGIPWNDTNFFICGDTDAGVDSIGPIGPGDTVTMWATVPLQITAPPVAEFVVHSPPAVARPWAIATGLFGAPVYEYDATGDLELVDDGSANPSEGCNPPIGFTVGNIAMIDRGNCEFGLKASLAQAAGAAGVVIVNDVPAQGIDLLMGAGAFRATVLLPTVLLSTADGDLLKAEMAVGPVNATLGHEHPEADWEIPMDSVVYDQYIDPNGDNDHDNSSVSVFPSLFQDDFESGDTTAWSTHP